jgi:hypothetical protein
VLVRGPIDVLGVLCRTSRVFQLIARKTRIKFQRVTARKVERDKQT